MSRAAGWLEGRGRLLLGAAAVVALMVAARLLPLQDWLKDLQGRLEPLGVWGPVLYGLGYVVAALLFVPGAALTIGAGLIFGFVRGLLVAWLSASAAAAAAFLIGRHLARARVEKWAARHERFQAIERAVRNKGGVMVLLLRLSPLVPFSVSNYLYGVSPVRFASYLWASALGMLPGTALYVYLGSAGQALGGRRSPAEWALLAAGLVATGAVTWLLTRAARQKLGRTAQAGS